MQRGDQSDSIAEQRTVDVVNVAIATVLLIGIALSGGCDVASVRPPVERSLSQVRYARGSRISYVTVTAGTKFVPKGGMQDAESVVLERDGWVLFIDEMPKADWAHPFKLLYVPTGLESGRVMFAGSAIPNFNLVTNGAVVTNRWVRY